MKLPIRNSLILTLILGGVYTANAAEFQAIVVDADTHRNLPARVYLQNESGEWLFVQSASTEGSALQYREQWVPMDGSTELHTTVSPHPFRIDVPPGKYQIEIEHGKEYLPLKETIDIGPETNVRTFELRRIVNAAARGWYSGETHVHRRISELPNVMLAEDLNVAFPVTFWTIQSDSVPDLQPSPLRRQGPSPFGPRDDRGTEPIAVDPTHVIIPRNTEYEIFNYAGKPHVLGAVFLLNHRSVMTHTAPPVKPIAELVHAEGGLLDLDKHSWPWSLMLVPVAKVDLFELSNNSVWRTQFGFSSVSAPLPDWASFEQRAPGQLTEWGWLNYGFEVYYALLNCGFRIMPTAGTASGVHPVPLGHSRVYVQTGDEFNSDAWIEGLRNGRSFVTTGPLLFSTINNEPPGTTITTPKRQGMDLNISVESFSALPLIAVEILINGDVAHRWTSAESPGFTNTVSQGGRFSGNYTLSVNHTSWIAVRCVSQDENGRKRFAHTAPWFIQVPGTDLVPRKQQVAFFVRQLESEIERGRPILSPEVLAEFQEALQVYSDMLRRAE
ncbi:MAG: CehA/McbA family metallohydrolase [Planctomyces sp.]|nr:CehA/McbA family metallohydrolase [Planctomyces sp.]